MKQTGGDKDMKDKQQAQCMFDRFGAEIYEGEEYFAGNDGDIFVCDSENFDPGNHVICDLVETMGTKWIQQSGKCSLPLSSAQTPTGRPYRLPAA